MLMSIPFQPLVLQSSQPFKQLKDSLQLLPAKFLTIDANGEENPE
jgi:hypothetical protein